MYQKTDIWKGILTWIESKQEELEREKLETTSTRCQWVTFGGRWETKFTSAQVAQALEMISGWVRYGGKGALEQAEYDLTNQPTDDIEQHIEQLLKMMEQQYWHNPPQTGIPGIWTRVSCKEIFKTMLEEIPKLIPKLIEMRQRFGLRYLEVEARLSTTFDKILRLSSWTPFCTYNENLRELLRNALLTLNDLGSIEEYNDNLREFMKRNTAFYAFTLDNADLIASEDSEKTAEVCKNLRRLAQNLKKIASTKATQYQILYEEFIVHREELSNWLDSASPGQGKLVYLVFKHRL